MVSIDEYKKRKKEKRNEEVRKMIDDVEREVESIDYDAVTRSVAKIGKKDVDKRFTDIYDKQEMERFKDLDADIPDEAWNIFND